MRPLLDVAALVVTASGVVCAALVLARSRDPHVAVRVLLDLLLAAGLLRLAHEPTWRRIALAAGIVAVRRLLSFALGQALVPRAARDTSR